MFAAKRARQINSYFNQLNEGVLQNVGPLVEYDKNEKPLSIAFREINEGLLEFETASDEPETDDEKIKAQQKAAAQKAKDEAAADAARKAEQEQKAAQKAADEAGGSADGSAKPSGSDPDGSAAPDSDSEGSEN